MKPYDKALSRPRRQKLGVRDYLDAPLVQSVGGDVDPNLKARLEAAPRSPKTNPEGFELAFAFFAERHGRIHGAKAYMATAIGVSRAVVDSWEGVGIPRRHLESVSKITGIAMTMLRPDPTK